MSGGLDSASVAAVAERLLALRGKRLTAFTEVSGRKFIGPVQAGHYADEAPFPVPYEVAIPCSGKSF